MTAFGRKNDVSAPPRADPPPRLTRRLLRRQFGLVLLLQELPLWDIHYRQDNEGERDAAYDVVEGMLLNKHGGKAYHNGNKERNGIHPLILSARLAVSEGDMYRYALKAVHAGKDVVRQVGHVDEPDHQRGQPALVRYRLLRRAAEIDLTGDDDIESVAYDHSDDKEKHHAVEVGARGDRHPDKRDRDIFLALACK